MPSITITLSPQQAEQLECFFSKTQIAHVESESEPPSFKLGMDMGGPYGNSVAVTCGVSNLILGEVDVSMDLVF